MERNKVSLLLSGLKTQFGEYWHQISKFKELFSTTKDVYGDLLGLDIDDTSIVSILLRNPLGSAIRVVTAGVEGLPSGVVVDDAVVDTLQLTTTLKKLLEKVRVKNSTANTVIAMPGSKVVIKQIRLDAPLSEADAEARAWQEARKTFPEIAKNLFLDFAQTEQFSIGKNKKFLLTLIATRKEDISPRVESLAQSGLVTKIVDVDYYALERSYQLFVNQLPANHAATHVALVDFNPHSILFVVMHKKRSVYYNRQIYTGDVLVPFVQRAMNLAVAPLKAKPVFLAPIRLTPMTSIQTDSEVAPAATPDDNVYIPDLLTEDQKSHVVMSFRRLFQSFYAENPGRVIEHIVITGRCALIGELTEHIGKMMDIPTIVANPLLNLKMNEDVDAERILKLGPAFAVACGLAMRGIPLWI